MENRFKFRVWCVNKQQWEEGKVYIDNQGFIDTCGLYIWFAEQNCFSTQEEAFVECKKRNIKLKNEQKSFTEKIKRLATMLHKKMDITIEFDSKEEENRSEIEEQIRYEAKGKSYEIRWINKE